MIRTLTLMLMRIITHMIILLTTSEYLMVIIIIIIYTLKMMSFDYIYSDRHIRMMMTMTTITIRKCRQIGNTYISE